MNTFIPALLLFASLFCSTAALLFIARVIASSFSAKTSEQIRQQPVLHIIWGCFAFIGILVFMGVLDPGMWPPRSVERREQRAKVMERVQAAGGWDAIRQGCISLAQENPDGFYSHFSRDTNGLPAAIVALKPMMVEYLPPNGCVRIRIFGIHSTGGRSTPYFGLEVDTSTNSVSYHHGAGYDNGGVIGNYHSVTAPVADGIYEIY